MHRDACHYIVTLITNTKTNMYLQIQTQIHIQIPIPISCLWSPPPCSLLYLIFFNSVAGMLAIIIMTNVKMANVWNKKTFCTAPIWKAIAHEENMNGQLCAFVALGLYWACCIPRCKTLDIVPFETLPGGQTNNIIACLTFAISVSLYLYLYLYFHL